MARRRSDEGIARVRELTGGDGTHTVLECVGLKPAIETAFGVVRDGSVVSRVGAPKYPDVPADFACLRAKVSVQVVLPEVASVTLISPG